MVMEISGLAPQICFSSNICGPATTPCEIRFLHCCVAILKKTFLFTLLLIITVIFIVFIATLIRGAVKNYLADFVR